MNAKNRNSGNSQLKLEKILVKIKDLVKGIESLRKIENKAIKKYGLYAIRHTKQFDDLLSDPIAYFAKKTGLECCTTVEELRKRLETDIRYQRIVSTSIGAQLRNLYEAWVFMGILQNLACTIVEPRDLTKTLVLRPITISNSATVVAEIKNGMYLAFFLDTPLPYQNTRIGQKYRSRPDIGIYLLESMQNPQEHCYIPTSSRLKLLALVECKESTVWPWTKKKIIDPFNESKEKIEVTHLQMLLFYEKLYSPPLLFLVSRKRTPERAHKVLSESDIEVYDEVGFNEEVLKKLASRIRKEIAGIN